MPGTRDGPNILVCILLTLRLEAILTVSDLDDGRGAILDYLGRFTRFGVSTFGVRHLKNASEGLSPLQEKQVRRCNSYAAQVLDWPLELGPVKRDQLRYISDYSWVMILFCCHFIVSACGTFPSIISDASTNLEKTAQIAQLIMRLTGDQDRTPYKEALQILRRVRMLQEGLIRHPKRNAVESPDDLYHNFVCSENGGSHMQELNELQTQDVDGSGLFWDFSTVFDTDMQADTDNPIFNF